MKRVFAISMMVALAFGGLTYAGTLFTMPGDSLITDGDGSTAPETNFNFKIMTQATAAAKYTNAAGTGAGMLGLSYTNFTQYGTVTISGSIAANTLNLDNASYMEIGLITKAAVEKSEKWYLSGMFNDSVFMLVSTNGSGQYSVRAGDYNLGGGRWSSIINFNKMQDLLYELQLDFATSTASLRIDNGAGWTSAVSVLFGIDDWTAAYPGSYGYLSPENFTQAALFANLYNEGTAGDYDSASFGDITVIPEPATLSILGLGVLSLIRRKK